jgi:hypothetical protein
MTNNYGQNIADTSIQGANARAAGLMGPANARQQMYGNLLSMGTSLIPLVA